MFDHACALLEFIKMLKANCQLTPWHILTNIDLYLHLLLVECF